jgi:hypothetical protein
MFAVKKGHHFAALVCPSKGAKGGTSDAPPPPPRARRTVPHCAAMTLVHLEREGIRQRVDHEVEPLSPLGLERFLDGRGLFRLARD